MTVPDIDVCILNDTRVASSVDPCPVDANVSDIQLFPLLGKGR